MGSAFWKFWERDGGDRGECAAVEARLEEYAGGAMPDGPEGGERSRIASHLTHCSRCRKAAADYERANLAWAAFASSRTPERPGDWGALRAKLRAVPMAEPSRSRSFVPFLSGRSMALTVVAVTAGAMAVMLPSPYRNNETTARTNVQNADASQKAEPIPDSVTAKNGDLTVASAFTNLNTQETFPVVATLTNPGAEADATFRISVFGGGGQRTYKKTVRLPANEKSSVTLYPRLGPAVFDRPTLYVNVTLHGKSQSASLPIGGGVANGQVGYIGDHIGALSPKLDQRRGAQYTPANPSYINAVYMEPENAPDRSVGYSGLESLVISHDGTRLSAAQWAAIREWAKSGGTVIMMGGGYDPLLRTKEGAELAPVRPVLLETAFATVQQKPGAQVRERIVSSAPQTPLADAFWRPLGAGTVLYTDFDATSNALREWEYYTTLWQRLTTMEISTLSQSRMIREAGHNKTIYYTSSQEQSDPFHLSLPSVRSVTYWFLAYFVLVVPVTFVTLKHTRRMNWAWVTGPTLAVLFAGAITLLTARLYFMDAARRTAGVVTLASGDPVGRFVGYTEIYFPHAGSYKIAIPGAELLEETVKLGDKGRSLTTTEDAKGNLVAPEFTVSNMSFRRLTHEQTVTLAGGVTATLLPDPSGGQTVHVRAAKAIIRNDTGLTLRDAAIVFSEITFPDPKHPTFKHREMFTYPLRDLKPGLSEIAIPADRVGIGVNQQGSGTLSDPHRPYLQYGQVGDEEYSMPRRPMLLASLDGGSFGPQLGKDCSGSGSVTVVVGLDADTGKGLAVQDKPRPEVATETFSVGLNGKPIPFTVSKDMAIIHANPQDARAAAQLAAKELAEAMAAKGGAK